MYALIADSSRLERLVASRTLHDCLFQKPTDVRQSCADVIGRNVVFALDLLKSHAAGKTPDDNRDGKSRTSDYGPPVVDGRIKHDSLMWVHGSVDVFLLT